MYNVNSSSTQFDILMAQKSGSTSSRDLDSLGIGSFGTSFKEMMANTGGIEDMLANLAGRFPGASVSKGKPAEGVEGSDKYFGKEEGDHVAVDESLLASMIGNNDLAKKVEEAISSFFNSAAGSNPMQGAYTQRSISITITTVRFNVNQREEGSGDMLTGQELQTAFQEKLQELINRFFGIESGSATGDGETEDAEDSTDKTDSTAAAKTDKSGTSSSSYNAMMFSMELFYSSSFMNNFGGSDSGQMSGQSMSFSMSYSSFSGNFQDFATNSLPQSMFQTLAGGGDFTGPFTSLLDSALGGMGMSSTGFSMSQSGFSFKMGQSNDLLSQLMDRIFAPSARPGTSEEAYESDETTEAEDVTEVPEEAAVE